MLNLFSSVWMRKSFGCLAFAGCLSSVRAEVQSLTDKQGRSLSADVISVENEKVKILRDDGQRFELPLASLSESDQERLREWAKANPPKLGPDALLLEFSRGKFSSEKEIQSGGSVTAYKDQWGYSITIGNRTKQELTSIRLEYILFVKQDDSSKYVATSGKFRRVKKSIATDPIPFQEKITFRTETVASYRYVLAPGWVWGSGGSKPIKDTLHGMWLRIYVGDELVIEKITPTDLAKTEKWED